MGKYTFVGRRGSSLVDYVLSSQSLFSLVKTFDVQNPNIMSDHCLVHFSLELAVVNEDRQNDDKESVALNINGARSEKQNFYRHYSRMILVID